MFGGLTLLLRQRSLFRVLGLFTMNLVSTTITVYLSQHASVMRVCTLHTSMSYNNIIRL